MNIRYESSFEKDLKKIKNKALLRQLKDAILTVKKARTPKEIPHFKKLTGHDVYYRISLGDHRIGLELDGDTLIFTRFLHRKDIYRFFP